MTLPGLVLLSLLSLSQFALASNNDVYNIRLMEDGRYRVEFSDLGYSGPALPVTALALFEEGQPVPFEMSAGEDGYFGSGDSFTFIGRHPSGESSWYDPHTAFSTYQLHLNGSRFPVPEPIEETQSPLLLHLEQNKLRQALPGRDSGGEHWYWQRISSLDSSGVSIELPVFGPARALRVALAGLSQDQHATAAGMAHHKVEFYLNGQYLATGEWQGQTDHIVEVELPATTSFGEDERAVLTIVVPQRNLPDSGQDLIDAILLNWVAVEFAANMEYSGATIPDRSRRYRLPVAEGLQQAVAITRADLASELRSRAQQADYLIITHPNLREAVKPLADYHRDTGLNVALVSVDEIYDQFNHGRASPLAVREFIAYAWRHWQVPAPRFVLLAGDAGWQIGDDRGLVPTLQVTIQGKLAASDNGLVSVSDDDWRPDLAVGRLPAGSAEEMFAMVEKILAYARSSPTGDWRRHSTWVSDKDESFQRISNSLAGKLEERGMSATRVYPSERNGKAHEQSRLIEELDRGALLVHFLGHGGRFVWRTGPPDYSGASDLFKVEDIQSLAPNARQPLLLSMTCSSGPFDHPTADSIAEAFLRAPDRGAIAVLAASWRVPASKSFSSLLVTALLQGDNRIGEAVLQAKRKESNRTLVEAYNLLGDPALALVTGNLP